MQEHPRYTIQELENMVNTAETFLEFESEVYQTVLKDPEKMQLIQLIAESYTTAYDHIELFKKVEEIRFRFENNFDDQNQAELELKYDMLKGELTYFDSLEEKTQYIEEFLVILYAAILENRKKIQREIDKLRQQLPQEEQNKFKQDQTQNRYMQCEDEDGLEM